MEKFKFILLALIIVSCNSNPLETKKVKETLSKDDMFYIEHGYQIKRFKVINNNDKGVFAVDMDDQSNIVQYIEMPEESKTYKYLGKFEEDKKRELYRKEKFKVIYSLKEGDVYYLEYGYTVHPHTVISTNVDGVNFYLTDIPSMKGYDKYTDLIKEPSFRLNKKNR